MRLLEPAAQPKEAIQVSTSVNLALHSLSSVCEYCSGGAKGYSGSIWTSVTVMDLVDENSKAGGKALKALGQLSAPCRRALQALSLVLCCRGVSHISHIYADRLAGMLNISYSGGTCICMLSGISSYRLIQIEENKHGK